MEQIAGEFFYTYSKYIIKCSENARHSLLIHSTFLVSNIYVTPITDLRHSFSMPASPSVAHQDSYQQGNMRMKLEYSELWKSFHDIGTEMVITKSGR